MEPAQYNEDLDGLIAIATIYEASLKVEGVKAEIRTLYAKVMNMAEQQEIKLCTYGNTPTVQQPVNPVEVVDRYAEIEESFKGNLE